MWLLVVLASVVLLQNVCCDDCVDSSAKIYGKSCYDYISEDNCRCKGTFGTFSIKDMCCETCVKLITDNCCKDRLSEDNPLWIAAYTKLTSCSEVRMDHQSLCEKSSFYEELGWCCATCKDLNGCSDNEADVAMSGWSCADIIKADPCYCLKNFNDIDMQRDCCSSCESVDTSGCHCKDLLSEQRPLTYTIDENRSTTFTDCSTLAELAPELCNSVRDRKCCASCVGVCVDDPYFRSTVKNRATKEICKRCTCAEIGDFDVMTARRVCEKKGKNRTAKKCCKMCSQVMEF